MKSQLSHRRIGVLALAAVAVATFAMPAAGDAAPGWTSMQILATNDFHGNLDPLPGAAGAVTALDKAGQETTL